MEYVAVVKPQIMVGPEIVPGVVGMAFTVMERVDVFTHPLASVPETVYVVDVVGTKETLFVTPPVQT
jgi:hypothetical protein